MSVVHVHSVDEYKKLIATEGKLVIVDFSATWCGPCKKIAPIYADLASKNTGALFLHVDIDELSTLDEVSSIQGVPTFHFIKDGKRIAEFAGANTERLTSTIAANL